MPIYDAQMASRTKLELGTREGRTAVYRIVANTTDRVQYDRLLMAFALCGLNDAEHLIRKWRGKAIEGTLKRRHIKF
jgi:hypothetical protein